MKQANYSNNAIPKMYVDVKELQEMLSLGRNKANEVGEAAGAVLRLGRRKLFSVKKIEEYLQQQALTNIH